MIANPYAYLPEHTSLQRILALPGMGADCRRYTWELLASVYREGLPPVHDKPTPWPLRVRFARSGLQHRAIPVVRRWVAVMLVAFCRRIQRGWRRRVARRRVARMTD